MTFQPPQTYKAYAFLERGGSLHKIDVEWKDPKPGHVVVKVLACGVCASDAITKDQWLPTTIYPRIPGHEIVGDVVAIAEGEGRWKLGDRVGAGWHSGYCNTCDRCRIGDFVTCSLSLGSPNGVGSDGGYAEYVTLRTESLASVPVDMDPGEAAPFLCAGVTTFNALRNMQVRPPDLVAVQGIGGLGHLAIQFANRMGFRTVALSSTVDKKDLAAKLGAHDFISGTAEEQAAGLAALGGAQVILCTGPSGAAMSALIGGLACGGQLVVIPLIPDTITIPIIPVLSQRLSIKGWPFGSGKDSEDAVKFAKLHGIKAMVTKFPLDKAEEAYEHRSVARFRAVLIPFS